MKRFRVELDKKACLAFGACVEKCPKFFQISDVDGKATIEGAKKNILENENIVETLELEELECIREAAEACPFNAIHITDLETNEQIT